MKAMHANTINSFHQKRKKEYGGIERKNVRVKNDEWQVGKCYGIPFMFYWMNDSLEISR